MNAELLAELKKLGDKVATELVFAEAEKDLGLLPVNSLLGQIEELANGDEAAQPLLAGIAQARQWMNGIFQASGFFTALSLKRFGEWVEWWQKSLSACETQLAVPPVPAAWENAGKIQAEAPSSEPKKDEPPLTLNLEQDRELLSEFINESQEHLQNIEQGVLVLEQHPADADTLNSIFQAFHTFKGGSGFLNLTAIQTVAHDLESLLDLARQQKLVITPAVINLILEGGDVLRQFCNEIAAQLTGKKQPATIVVPTLRLLERIRQALGAEPAAAIETPAIAPVKPAAETAKTEAILPEPPYPPVAPAASAQGSGTPVRRQPLERWSKSTPSSWTAWSTKLGKC